MKILKINLVLIALFALSFSLNSCKGQTKKSTAIEKSENQGPEYTSAYICPMHCEGSGSDKEGKCPVCGMDYVKNENYNN